MSNIDSVMEARPRTTPRRARRLPPRRARPRRQEQGGLAQHERRSLVLRLLGLLQGGSDEVIS